MARSGPLPDLFVERGLIALGSMHRGLTDRYDVVPYEVMRLRQQLEPYARQPLRPFSQPCSSSPVAVACESNAMNHRATGVPVLGLGPLNQFLEWRDRQESCDAKQYVRSIMEPRTCSVARRRRLRSCWIPKTATNSQPLLGPSSIATRTCQLKESSINVQ